MTDALLAITIGLAAGVVAGMLGVGGGILFVPALSFVLGLGQLEAESTSLLAIVPVSLLGAYRQYGYGNVRVKDGLVVGVLALAGVALGVVLANAIPERGLEIGFALLMLFVAGRMARSALRPTQA